MHILFVLDCHNRYRLSPDEECEWHSDTAEAFHSSFCGAQDSGGLTDLLFACPTRKDVDELAARLKAYGYDAGKMICPQGTFLTDDAGGQWYPAYQKR